MAEEPHLICEERDGILIVSLNRADKLNALSGETMQLFEAALLRLRDEPSLRVMLVRANGRYFSAGADMKGGSDRPRPETATEIRENHRIGLHGMHRIYDEMEHIEKPIVSAIHSTCVGGGLELVLSCDFRLAAESAEFAFPEGVFGVLPASNGVSRLTRLCGPHWARWLIMGNQKADAERALIMGLVHDVVPDEGFDDAAMDFCRHLTKSDPEQMGAAKIAIELAADLGRDQGRHIERMANSALMLNPPYRQRIADYIAKIGTKKG